MTEQQLDGAHIGARFQQVSGEGVTQRMGRDRLGDAAGTVRFVTGLLDGASRDRLTRNIAGK